MYSLELNKLYKRKTCCCVITFCILNNDIILLIYWSNRLTVKWCMWGKWVGSIESMSETHRNQYICIIDKFTCYESRSDVRRGPNPRLQSLLTINFGTLTPSNFGVTCPLNFLLPCLLFDYTLSFRYIILTCCMNLHSRYTWRWNRNSYHLSFKYLLKIWIYI